MRTHRRLRRQLYYLCTLESFVVYVLRLFVFTFRSLPLVQSNIQLT